jgi:hypothetical protein
MITPILGVHVGSHSPDCILKTQGRAHVRWSMKRPQVVGRVDDGQEMLLRTEKYAVATWLWSTQDGRGGALAGTYRSSIISKGGRLSNWPNPNNSPVWALSPLEGDSVEDRGLQGIAPSSGLPRGRSGRDGSPPSVAGEESSVQAPSDWADWLARCLPTVLSRPSTWAGSGSMHGWA